MHMCLTEIIISAMNYWCSTLLLCTGSSLDIMADCYEGSMGANFRFVITNVRVDISLVECNEYAHNYKPDKSRRKAWEVCIRFPLQWIFPLLFENYIRVSALRNRHLLIVASFFSYFQDKICLVSLNANYGTKIWEIGRAWRKSSQICERTVYINMPNWRPPLQYISRIAVGNLIFFSCLTPWDRVTHICASKLTSWCQVIIWTNARIL